MTKTSSTKKLALSAGLLTTGLVAGAMFSPLGLAGAQESDSDGTDANSESTDAGHHHGLGSHRGEVAEVLGIDADTLRAGFADDKTLVEIAAENGLSEQEVLDLLTTAAEEHLAAAVEDGRITQERADERAADMADRITERINTVPSEREGRRGRGHGRLAAGLEVLEDLGLTQDELQAGREAGQTLAETAEANGIDDEALVAALVAAAEERAAEAVESGRVTQDQVDEHLADVEERITERVNAEPGDRPDRGRRGFGHGHGDAADADTEGASLSF